MAPVRPSGHFTLRQRLVSFHILSRVESREIVRERRKRYLMADLGDKGVHPAPFGGRKRAKK